MNDQTYLVVTLRNTYKVKVDNNKVNEEIKRISNGGEFDTSELLKSEVVIGSTESVITSVQSMPLPTD